jgi:hypothetical protein
VQHYTPHQAEVQRIQNKLVEFLTPRIARELAEHIYDLALEVEDNINRILQDPRVEKLYEYDGQFFTPRGTNGFHTAFDGLHVLISLGNSIDTLFMTLPMRAAVECLLNELDGHRWVAKRRRMNWEECGTLGLVPEEIIREIIAAQKREQGEQPLPLSVEEHAFFKSFEIQLEQIGMSAHHSRRVSASSKPHLQEQLKRHRM